jgi:hypothetical protein
MRLYRVTVKLWEAIINMYSDKRRKEGKGKRRKKSEGEQAITCEKMRLGLAWLRVVCMSFFWCLR